MTSNKECHDAEYSGIPCIVLDQAVKDLSQRYDNNGSWDRIPESFKQIAKIKSWELDGYCMVIESLVMRYALKRYAEAIDEC